MGQHRALSYAVARPLVVFRIASPVLIENALSQAVDLLLQCSAISVFGFPGALLDFACGRKGYLGVTQFVLPQCSDVALPRAADIFRGIGRSCPTRESDSHGGPSVERSEAAFIAAGADRKIPFNPPSGKAVHLRCVFPWAVLVQ